jgi:hypothetical protein
MAFPLPSTNSITAAAFVISPMRTGGLSACWVLFAPLASALMNVRISHSAALPCWFAGGVVAVTSIRAQSTSSVRRPVPAVS